MRLYLFATSIYRHSKLIVLTTCCVFSIITSTGQTTIEFTPAEGVVDVGKSIQVSLTARQGQQPVIPGNGLKIYYTIDGSKATEKAMVYTGGYIDVLPPDGYNTVTLNVMTIDNIGLQTNSAATYVFYTPGQEQLPTEQVSIIPRILATDATTDDNFYYQITNTDNLNEGDIIMFVAGSEVDKFFITMGKYITLGPEVPAPINGVIESPIPANTSTFRISHSSKTPGAWHLLNTLNNKYWAPTHEGDEAFKSFLFEFAENSDDAKDFFFNGNGDGTVSLVAQDAEIKACITPNEIDLCGWAFARERKDFNVNPMIFRLGYPEPVTVTVPKEISEELYLTLESNLAAEGRPTAYRLKYSPETRQYHATINDLWGDIVIRDGRATLDGIYFGAKEDINAETLNHDYRASNIPQIGSPVSWTDNPNIILSYCPETIRPLSTSGNIPLKIVEAKVIFDHQPGSTEDANIALDNLNSSDILPIEKDDLTIPIYYNLQGIKLPHAPATPGVYIKVTGANTSRILVSQ